MVSFICDACGNTVKKNQVEKHYQTACRNCSVLSCIDCGVDFPGDAYVAHTSCISEAEKYQGHLYQPKDKENKGDAKQKEWIKQVQGATVKDPKLKSLLEKLSEYSNIPRKKRKFENFCKNSVKVYDAKTLDSLWEIFNQKSNQQVESNNSDKHSENGETNCTNESDKDEKEIKSKKKRKHAEDDGKTTSKKKKKEEAKITDTSDKDNDDDAENLTKGKFHWHKAIKTALKEAEDNELSIKKLRKKVIAAYEEHGLDHRASNIEESKTLFEKKLNTYPKVKIIKNKIVKLCKT